MPEKPEVITVAKSLERELFERTIVDCQVYWDNIIAYPMVEEFREKIDDLCNLYDNVYNNYLKLSNQLSYVHKDFNRRNVLWESDIPYIIDWETATISNPSIDFFNSAWFLTADVNIDKYTIFCTEYFKKNKLEDDINAAAYASIIEECNWLEFCLKRLNSSNIEEVNLGKNSIKGSLIEILNYYNKIPLMISIIKRISEN